jgi:hypothetical protein
MADTKRKIEIKIKFSDKSGKEISNLSDSLTKRIMSELITMNKQGKKNVLAFIHYYKNLPKND